MSGCDAADDDWPGSEVSKTTSLPDGSLFIASDASAASALGSPAALAGTMVLKTQRENGALDGGHTESYRCAVVRFCESSESLEFL